MQWVDEPRMSGAFTIAAGTEVQGDLSLSGPKTTLDLHSKDFFNTNNIPDRCILGALHDRTKVSLIDCITLQGPGSGSRGDEHYSFSRIFPHFVVFGDEHITPSHKKITSVSFQVDDAATLFYDIGAFSTVTDASSYMARLAEEEHERGQNVVVGDHPMLFYFTGKNEIFKADTALGTIRAEHRPSYTIPGPRGIRLDNNIYVDIAFRDMVIISEAITAIHSVLRFIEIIAGRPQTVLRLVLEIPGSQNRPSILDVYWSMSPSRDGDASERLPQPDDLPIQAAQAPEYFANVLTNWLAKESEMRNARFRFSSGFALQNQYTIDRLVGAANMFDILPESAVPADVQLTCELEKAKAQSRALFSPLLRSPERDSVLSALGRLGKATLRHKVCARAKLILDRIPSCLPELELVINEAIDCRNYFVHGSETNIDYAKNFNQVAFLTEALEFIFAASDLVDCGWNIEEWSKQSSTMSHPFGLFRINYVQQLKDLKNALSEAQRQRRTV